MGKPQQMIDTEQEQKMLWIAEILTEASRWGLRWEVETWAKKFMEEDPELDIVEAYQNAFNEWIK